jgi:hypothetical protein
MLEPEMTHDHTTHQRGDPFWASLAVALVIAFVLTVPVNRWLIGRGKGHAVMHAYH